MPKGVTIAESTCWTVVRMLACHKSPEEVRAFTDVSPRQQRRIMKCWRETAEVKRNREGPEMRGRPRTLSSDDVAFLQGAVDRSCDTYLDELQESLGAICGAEVSLSTIWRTLRRKGYRMKKITRKAIERSVRKRAKYTYKIGVRYTSDQLVFVDESAADRRTTYRGYAWALGGSRAVRKAFFVRGRRYSILPALSLNGIIAVDIVEGSFNTSRFARFIDGLLDQMNQFPWPNSVIVMDNCRIHKCQEILDMITERGMRYEFLPPYSPDYNPIELAFSAIKAYIRRSGGILRASMEDKDDMDVYLQLIEAVYSVTAENAEGWFRHAGY